MPTYTRIYINRCMHIIYVLVYLLPTVLQNEAFGMHSHQRSLFSLYSLRFWIKLFEGGEA